MAARVPVVVVREWDWHGVPQVEVEYSDGTRDSVRKAIFDDLVSKKELVKVEKHAEA